MYAQKEDLLHEVLELEAEKGLLVSGESTKYQVGVTWYHVSREESVSQVGFKSQTSVPLYSVLNTLSEFTPRSMWKCLLAMNLSFILWCTFFFMCVSYLLAVCSSPLKKIKEEKGV